jgi:hypothetical protein
MAGYRLCPGCGIFDIAGDYSRGTGKPDAGPFGVKLTRHAHLGQLRRRWVGGIGPKSLVCWRLYVQVDRFLMADQATKWQALGQRVLGRC